MTRKTQRLATQCEVSRGVTAADVKRAVRKYVWDLMVWLVHKQNLQNRFKGSVERPRRERHFCSLLPYFLLSWLQIFQLCLSFWTSSFHLVLFKNSFRKNKNIRKTTQNALAPSIFKVLSIVLKLGTPLLLPWTKKKNHARDSRREERWSMCDIMLDHARSAQGKSRGSELSVRWSLLIKHYHKIEQCSSCCESRGWLLFFFCPG